MNRDSASTCVARREGSSVVHITWATSVAFRGVSGWGAVEVVETLSDHLYLFMEAKDTHRSGTASTDNGGGPPRGRRACSPPRWKVKERDEDLLRAASPEAMASPNVKLIS